MAQTFPAGGSALSATKVQSATDPGSGVNVTAGGTLGRWVTAYYTYTPSTISTRGVDFYVEDGVGSDNFLSECGGFRASDAGNGGGQFQGTASFFVPSGHRYRYTATGTGSALLRWHYVEV